jgi:hypothetical protein
MTTLKGLLRAHARIPQAMRLQAAKPPIMLRTSATEERPADRLDPLVLVLVLVLLAVLEVEVEVPVFEAAAAAAVPPPEAKTLMWLMAQ